MPPREKKHSPVPVQRPRPARKQGRVTIEDVEAVVRWYLETHCYTPWFDTEAAASYLRKEPGTLKGWRSRGYLENGGAAFVKHWLLQRQTVLNGQGIAPPTSGKETMRRMSMGDAEAYLLDLYDGLEAPFDFDLVRVDDLVQAVPAKLAGRSGSLRSRLAKFLKDDLTVELELIASG